MNRSTQILARASEAFMRGLRRPRRPRRSKAWQELQALGAYGVLAGLVNDRIMLPVGSTRTRAPRWVEELAAALLHRRTGLPKGLGHRLRAVLNRWGWRVLQMALLWMPVPKTGVWQQAMTESLLFDHLGFRLAWCDYGKHWYFSDRDGRKDCVPHRRAGQAARWRARARARQREAARQATTSPRGGRL